MTEAYHKCLTGHRQGCCIVFVHTKKDYNYLRTSVSYHKDLPYRLKVNFYDLPIIKI